MTTGTTRTTGVIVASVTLLGLLMAQPVGAGTQLNTVDDTATLDPSGHNVVVTGPIKCTEGETVELEVTITQDSTDAVAGGRTHLRCTGEVQQWTIHAATRGPDAFQEGDAHADAWGQTRFRGTVTDTTDEGWERGIELIRAQDYR